MIDIQRCPDEGVCYHDCPIDSCFRVRHCVPLSGQFPGNRWPDAVKLYYGKPIDDQRGEYARALAWVSAYIDAHADNSVLRKLLVDIESGEWPDE